MFLSTGGLVAYIQLWLNVLRETTLEKANALFARRYQV